ncbi:MAG: 4Fe-4S cluster-binding domain-containing protein [Clostridia bacterium]|nr:4Fe-4S cluster-binding domain-containing protein [Clostridia bacterium]
MNSRVKLVNLLMTRACNLRCAYCYVRHGFHDAMTEETAHQAIQDAFARDADDFDRIEFAFLGGEPFLAFPVLKAVCEWMWSREWPKPYCLSASTNGTVITGEIREWLARNHHRFFISLSYDGGKDTQNENRSGSAEKIDLMFFQKYWPQVPLKLTADEQTVDHLARDVMDLKERGFLVNDTFADGVPPWEEDSLRRLDGQLARLCAYDLAHPGQAPSRLLNIDLSSVLSNVPKDSFCCGAGHSQVTYDWEGSRHPCHLLSPLVLSPEEMEQFRREWHAPKKTLTGCQGCPLDSICPACGGNAFRMHHTCWRREAKTCALFLHQLYYACVFQMKRLLADDQRTGKDFLAYAAVCKIMGLQIMQPIIAGAQPV